MQLTPEMIDAATLQLRMLFEHDPTVPENVKNSGKAFLDDLDAWSEEMKKAKAAA